MTFLLAAVVNFSLDLAFQVSKIEQKPLDSSEKTVPNCF